MFKISKNIYIVAVIAVAALIVLIILASMKTGKNIPDVKNISYTVSGETFLLKDGKAEKIYSDGSAAKNTLMMFGEPVYGDLDGDGDQDAAVLLANSPGGSGTFYFAALAINNNNEYRATKSMLLGDRIAPQTVEIHEGRAVYNFAERKGGEPMTAQPSVGKSVWVHYDKTAGEIGEWVKDFEGESAAIKCLPEQRKADVCAEIYQPVCATVEIQCIKAPCNPIQETFSNACNACKNSFVKTYIPGKCR